MKQKHYINLHKGFTFLALLIMMAIYDQWQNSTAWVYLALHGSYGILWVAKSRIFPDKQWEQLAGVGWGLMAWGGLTLYWIGGWIVTSQNISTPGWLQAFAITSFTIGIFYHFASDMQKYVALALRPNELIDDGMFARTRNINYFGEFLIYLGFGALAMHWLPIIILVLFIMIVWIPNMRRKDRSLSRYPNFPGYKSQSKFFIPLVF